MSPLLKHLDLQADAPGTGAGTWDYERALGATSRFLSITHRAKPSTGRSPYQPCEEDGRAVRVAGRSVINTIQPVAVPILDPGESIQLPGVGGVPTATASFDSLEAHLRAVAAGQAVVMAGAHL
jgi:hypothetical protein